MSLGSPSLRSNIKLDKSSVINALEKLSIGSPTLPSKIKTTLDDLVSITSTYTPPKTSKFDFTSYLSPININTNSFSGSPTPPSYIKPIGLECILERTSTLSKGSPSLSSYISKNYFSNLEKISVGSPTLPSKIKTNLSSLLDKTPTYNFEPFKPKLDTTDFSSYLTPFNLEKKEKKFGSPTPISKINYGSESLLDKPMKKSGIGSPSYKSYLTDSYSFLDKPQSKGSPSPKSLINTTLLEKEKPLFSFSFEKKKEPHKFNFDYNPIGETRYNSLDKNSLFKKDNLLDETKKLMQDFRIRNNFLNTVRLKDNSDEEDIGFGGAYDWKYRKIEISPFPTKDIKDYGDYPSFVKDNILPHEFGHIKVVEKFGAEEKKWRRLDPKFTYYGEEHTADMFARRYNNKFEFSQNKLLQDIYYDKDSVMNKPLKSEDDGFLSQFSYYKASAREFNLPEVEKKIDYNLYESLLKKSKNNYSFASKILDEINEQTDEIQTLGFNASSLRDTFDYISKLKKIQEKEERIDRDYLRNTLK